MQFKTKIATLTAVLSALSSSAWSQAIVQSNPINIAAVVTIGGPPASVTQTGKYNYAGVVQAGVTPTASIAQNGTAVNSAFIGQSGRSLSGTISQSGGPRVMNAAAVGQYVVPSGSYGFRRR